MKNSEFRIKNSKLKITLLCPVFCVLCAVFSACRPLQHPQQADFPSVMVGTWETWFGPEQKWAITFDRDGAITGMHHYVFGPMTAEEGGVYKDGPDPGTYMVAVLGPLQTEYVPLTNRLKATITIDSYTMQFVEGALKGRVIDKLEGPVTEDGTIWNVEWRSYGWLEGAAEPDIQYIDENPASLRFLKSKSDQ